MSERPCMLSVTGNQKEESQPAPARRCVSIADRQAAGRSIQMRDPGRAYTQRASRLAVASLIAVLLASATGASREFSNPAAGDRLLYSEVLGIPGFISAVAADSNGNSYVAGVVATGTFPVTPGVLQPQFGGGLCLGLGPFSPSTPCQDAFVMKFDAEGRVLFATYMGGGGADFATSIAVDARGDVYVAGSTANGLSGPPFPVTAGAAFPSLGTAGSGGFVAKLSSDGSRLLYSTVLPGLPVVALAIDTTGNAYVAGNVIASVPFSVPAGAFQSKFQASSGSQPFIAKLNDSGSALLYGTYLGGSNTDVVAALSVDGFGNAYLAGTAHSTDFPTTPGALETKLTPSTPGTASSDGFLTKLNATGSALIYSTYAGGSGADSITGLGLDSAGNAYIIGQTTSSDFPTTPGALAPTGPEAPWTPPELAPNGGFAAAINAAGNAFLYSTYLPGVASIAADPNGNAYVAGSAIEGFPVTRGAAQGCFSGTTDVFLAELSPAGALLQSTYLGGASYDTPAGIAVAAGNVIVTGSTSSYDFPRMPTVRRSYVTAQPFLARLRISDPASESGPCTTLVIQNAASYYEGPLVPGELISIYGPGIGPGQAVYEQVDASGNIARQLGGVQVMFDDIAAPLLYAQDRQVNAVVPFEVYGKTLTHVQIVFQGQPVRSGDWEVEAAFPGVFLPLLYVDAPPGTEFPAAKAGSLLSIWGTGLGQMDPAGITGLNSTGTLGHPILPVKVRIGGIDAEVLYAGDAPYLPLGMFQINVRIPKDVPPQTPVTCGVALSIQAGDTRIEQPWQVCVDFSR